MAISASDVKTLRDRTNAPMMDCKAALTAVDGDLEKAIRWLREKFKDIKPKEGRETTEGRIAIFIDHAERLGAILEMRCESAPVAKGEHFTRLASNLARVIALQNPADVNALLACKDSDGKSVQDEIGEQYGLLRETMKPHRFVRLTGLLGEYTPHDGSVGVLLQVEGEKADPQLLRDICMHVTAKSPVAARREDVPPAVIAQEKEIAKVQAANTGKPEKIVEMIAENKMKTWFAENVLLEQPFVKDETKTIGDLLKNAGLKLVRFVRYKVGEL